jgi:hypothetical protein
MRTVVIPETTVTEDINLIEETPGIQVRFLVGQKESNGNWVVPQQFETFIVSGKQYDELNGPPLPWCPDKPVGTYRNEDLWHYVDMARG